VVLMAELLGERLRALEARGRRRRAEGAEPRGREAIDEAEREGQLRADDGQIDGGFARKALEAREIVRPRSARTPRRPRLPALPGAQ